MNQSHRYSARDLSFIRFTVEKLLTVATTKKIVLILLQYGIMVGIGVSLLMLLGPWRKPKINVGIHSS